MSRLLSLLLLYKGGYEVGRFVSLEKLIEQSKETYYDALGRSTVGWHEGAHDLSRGSRTSSGSSPPPTGSSSRAPGGHRGPRLEG